MNAQFPCPAGPGCAVAIAIPVKDEAERIGGCLRSLAGRHGNPDHQVVLLLNNCTDATAAVVAALRPSLPMTVHAIECTLPRSQASAGFARRLAMQHAARLLRPNGVLMTTDADGCATPGWIAANLAAMRDGAKVVAGQAVIDPVEAALIPQHLHDDDALECAYADLLDEIDALADPDPTDPWPRHSEHSGASIAVTLDAYLRAGGIPAVKMGEDRAFVAALWRIDAPIRHALGVQVVVSGRTVGRAAGGMADTMRRRIVHQDSMIDDRLEPAHMRARRAALRVRFAAARRAGDCPPLLSLSLGVAHAELAAAMALPFVGAGWAMLEACSPALLQQGVARADLHRELRRARDIRNSLLNRFAATNPGGIAALADAVPA